MLQQNKYEMLTQDYWLVIQAIHSQLHVKILQSSKSRKLSCFIPIDLQNPLLLAFDSSYELLGMVKNGNNYDIDFSSSIFILKWKMVGIGFQKNILFQANLKDEKMSEIQQLKCENMLLKKKLTDLTKTRSKNAEFSNTQTHDSNKFLIKIQSNQFSEDSQKIIQDNKELVQLEVLSRQADSRDDIESMQYESRKHRTRQIKKKQKKKRSQICRQKSEEEPKSVSIKVHQNQPKKRGRKKKTEMRGAEVNQSNESTTPSFQDKIKISFANGDYYYGQVKNDMYNGHGIYYSEVNGTFEGIWENGKANGFGICQDPVGNRHSGYYIDDKRTGKGIDEYVNGQKYEGYFQQDSKCGYGKYTYQNGDCYEGEWKNDNYNGKGVQTYNDGSKYEGHWIDDQKDGEGIFTSADGKKYKQLWVKGMKKTQQQIM